MNKQAQAELFSCEVKAAPAPAASRNAIIGRSGKSIRVGAVVIYSDQGDAARAVLRHVATLLNNSEPAAEPNPSGCSQVVLSEGGGRIDIIHLKVSLRARGASPANCRDELARIAQLLSAYPLAEASADSPSASSARFRHHRFHLAVVEPHRLRLESPSKRVTVAVKGDEKEVAAVAWRIATAWNTLEGWPTPELEGNVLAMLRVAAKDVVAAHEQGRDCTAAIAALAELLQRGDRALDRTNERLHDCPQCITPAP